MKYCRDCKYKVDVRKIIGASIDKIEYWCGLWEAYKRPVDSPYELDYEVPKWLKDKLNKLEKKYKWCGGIGEWINGKWLLKCECLNEDGNCEFYKEKFTVKFLKKIRQLFRWDWWARRKRTKET